MEWKKALVAPGSSLKDVIRNLDESSLQITLVVSTDGTLVGTVTDGDVRRGLLRGMSLDQPIDDIMYREPLVVPPEFGRDMILQLMQANKLHQLPVVDANRRVVGLHLWEEVTEPPKRPNIMVIMAGGEGSRLRPHTDDCPKPMLPVGGKPMLEHIIERARAEGIQNFVLSIRYLGDVIRDHFGDGSKWNVHIEYVEEDAPLGTAGALGLLDPRPGDPILVSNGDVLTDIRYGELLNFHATHSAAATMAVRLHEWQHPFGVVRTDGVDIVGFDEKPVSRTHINAGVYVLDPASLDSLVAGELCHMPTLFERIQGLGRRTVVYPMHEPWLDIGSVSDLARARDTNSEKSKE